MEDLHAASVEWLAFEIDTSRVMQVIIDIDNHCDTGLGNLFSAAVCLPPYYLELSIKSFVACISLS